MQEDKADMSAFIIYIWYICALGQGVAYQYQFTVTLTFMAL